MKAFFAHDEITQLTLIPQVANDELLIAMLLRVILRGGIIYAISEDGSEVIAKYTGRSAKTIDPEDEKTINEYIEMLRRE